MISTFRRFPHSLTDDVLSGFLVFLVALPLCLGISIASGFPPAAGIVTAIVGGLLGPLLGSARLTIKGPAAGLIVIVLGSVVELGGGDPVVGYHRTLAVGVVAAVIQVAFALLRCGKLGCLVPPAVVRGMLTAIGVIILARQTHAILGVTPSSSTPLGQLLELPRSLMAVNPAIALIGLTALFVLFGRSSTSPRGVGLSRIPSPVLVLLLVVPIGLALRVGVPHEYSLFGLDFHLGPEFLLSLPGNLLDALVFPDFSVVFSATSLKYVAMFALVGSIESVLSTKAVDELGPSRLGSDLDRDLLAVGVGNLMAASIGGLPMISEIVRSKANIDAGAKSGWSNFFHGLFLLVFVASVPGLLQHIPLAALAAMLVYTGAQLASPGQARSVCRAGRESTVLFVSTLVTTLAIDLLVGITVGVCLKQVIRFVDRRPSPLESTAMGRTQR